MFTMIQSVFNLQAGDMFQVTRRDETYFVVEFTNVFKLPGELTAPIQRKQVDGTQPLKLWLSHDFVSKYAKPEVQ